MISRPEPPKTANERERIIFQAIKDNSNLHHNALIKKIVPKFMAKTTFEKTKNSLLEKEIISVEQNGNMKFYRFSENYEAKSQQLIERNTNTSFHDLKMNLKKIKTDFSHKDIDEKILFATMLLKKLIQTDSGFTILDSAKNPHKTLYRDEHLAIQELISQIFEVIRNDKDSQILFPAIMSNVGDMMPKSHLDKQSFI